VRQALLRPNTTERVAIYSSGIANGWMSPNEVRALENMNPREGGDEYLTPLNMTTSSQVAVEDEPEEEEPEDEPEDEPTEDDGERMRPLIAESLRRAVRRVGHYAKRESKTPGTFGNWLERSQSQNLEAVTDCIAPIAKSCNASTFDLVVRFFREVHGEIEKVYSTSHADVFERDMTECVLKLETELPVRWADELTKGDKP
jgi:hypothetical protein